MPRRSRTFHTITAGISALLMALAVAAHTVLPVSAVTSQELQQQRDETQSQLNSANAAASSLEGQQEVVAEEMEAAELSLVQNLASIQILEDQIARTETEIAVKQAEYDAAYALEQEQYAAMKKRIQYMYEQGDITYMQILLTSSSLGDALNKNEYIEKLYEYDQRLLQQYTEAKQATATAQVALEDVQAEQEASKEGLEEERQALQSKMDSLQATYDDYETRIANAREEARRLRTQVQQQTAAIAAAQEAEARAAEERRRQEEEARRRAEEEARKAAEAAANAANGTQESAQEGGTAGQDSSSSQTSESTSSQSSSSTSSSSSSSQRTYASPSGKTGQDVANYACQFVGNPYVYGGTSLTNGCDCSGFTMTIYSNFGYSIPRTAESQRGAGIAVASLEEAIPGDLICYAGHVAMYIGNGTIVHASTRATGIKYSVATYRPIICIRRIIH